MKNAAGTSRRATTPPAVLLTRVAIGSRPRRAHSMPKQSRVKQRAVLNAICTCWGTL